MSHAVAAYHFHDKPADYARLSAELTALLAGEHDPVANAANTAALLFGALLFGALPEVNWAGFYFLRGAELVVGPFQGKPACVRIALGRGVCGTAAVERRTLVVPDVHAFPGHIACDAASRSEIVVPLIRGGELLGVLDVDSPRPGRFDAADAHGLEEVVRVFVASTTAVLAAPG
jgi:GAF domain-containing protein